MINTYYILPVQILRAPLITSRYNPTSTTERDWTHSAVAWTGKGWLAPKGSQSEDMNNREQDSSYSWLFLPPDATIFATDRVTISGDLYQIYGEPVTANAPRGLHHYEVRVLRVVG